MNTIEDITIKIIDDYGDIGVFADATISYRVTDYRRFEVLKSGGLWGIDGDHEYYKEVAQDQLIDLKEHLTHFNVNLKNFDEMANEAIDNMNFEVY